jgi:pimeloyl-ACP methyl ester carboxylesterase
MTVSDIKLHYRIWINEDSINSHKWILLLHGMGGSTYSWENNAKVFCDSGYNVVAVDIPPYGYSEKNPDYNYSTDNISALMWKFAKRINDKYPWILIGHSMGGGIAQCMAIEKPKKVKKIVFVAPALFSELKPGRDFGQFITAFRPVERLMSVLGETFYIKKNKIRKILESSFASEVPDEVVNQYYKALNNDGFTTAFLRSFSKSNPSKQVNGLDFNIKSLAFFGTADTWVPYSQTKNITDQLHCIKIVSIENAGHSLMETNSPEFNKQVLQFLNSQD